MHLPFFTVGGIATDGPFSIYVASFFILPQYWKYVRTDYLSHIIETNTVIQCRTEKCLLINYEQFDY